MIFGAEVRRNSMETDPAVIIPALLAAAGLSPLKEEVAVMIAVLDRLEGAADNFAARGLPFRSLLTIRDLGVEPLGPA